VGEMDLINVKATIGIYILCSRLFLKRRKM